MYRFGPKNTFGIRKDWCLVVKGKNGREGFYRAGAFNSLYIFIYIYILLFVFFNFTRKVIIIIII